MLEKSDLYLKKVELEYMNIYGIKGIVFCNNMKRCSKLNPKKKFKVKFSNDIQYSRN